MDYREFGKKICDYFGIDGEAEADMWLDLMLKDFFLKYWKGKIEGNPEGRGN